MAEEFVYPKYLVTIAMVLWFDCWKLQWRLCCTIVYSILQF